MKRALLALLLLAGCTKHLVESTKMQTIASELANESKQTTAVAAHEEHVETTTAPTVIEQVVVEEDAATPSAPARKITTTTKTTQGEVVKVVEAQAQEHVAVAEAKQVVAAQTTAAETHRELKTRPALSCAFSGALWIVVVLGALAALAWRLKPAWLNWLWKLF